MNCLNAKAVIPNTITAKEELDLEQLINSPSDDDELDRHSEGFNNSGGASGMINFQGSINEFGLICNYPVARCLPHSIHTYKSHSCNKTVLIIWYVGLGYIKVIRTSKFIFFSPTLSFEGDSYVKITLKNQSDKRKGITTFANFNSLPILFLRFSFS